jgi:hypothetical protein
MPVWAVEIPDHASVRYLQRAQADENQLRDALFNVGVSFMTADTETVLGHVATARPLI